MTQSTIFDVKEVDKIFWKMVTDFETKNPRKWGHSFWDVLNKNKVKENKMHVIEKAKEYLEKISSGKWEAYTQKFNTHEEMLNGIEVSIRQGSADYLSGVILLDDLQAVCITGNGKQGRIHSEFIAAAPDIIKELLNELEELRYKRDELCLEVIELKEQVKDLEDHIWNKHWFVPNGDYICTVDGVEYIIIDRELFHKDKERMDKRLQLLEGAQNIFPDENTAHKILLQNGVEYVIINRELYSEELKNAAIENTQRAIRQTSKRHEAKIAGLEGVVKGRDATIAHLENNIKEWKKANPKAGEYIKAIQRCAEAEKAYDVRGETIAILRETVFKANEQIGKLKENAIEQDELIRAYRENSTKLYGVIAELETRIKELKATWLIRAGKNQNEKESEIANMHLSEMVFEKIAVIDDLETKYSELERKYAISTHDKAYIHKANRNLYKAKQAWKTDCAKLQNEIRELRIAHVEQLENLASGFNKVLATNAEHKKELVRIKNKFELLEY